MENFRLNKIKNKMKLVKATILAGLMIITPACEEKKIEEKQEPTTEAIMETEVTEPITEIETTVEKMIKQKTTTTKTVKTTTSKHDYEEPTTENREEEKEEPTTVEETTQEPTEPTTERKGRINTSKVAEQFVKPSGNSNKEETHRTEKVTTTKPVTTTKKTTTTTYTTTTTTTTAAPTTEPVTEPITEAPTEPQVTYDYTLENITQSADVFNYFADRMNNDILNRGSNESIGASILLEDCDGNEYWTNGSKEAKVALLLLNDNQQYNNCVLSDIFDAYSDYDIRNGVLYLEKMALIEECTNIEIDFNTYTTNKEIGNYMNNLKNAARIARETGNCDELNSVLYLFTEDGNYQFLQNNYAALMLTIGYGSRIEGNKYYETYGLEVLCGLNNYENTSSEVVKRHIY